MMAIGAIDALEKSRIHVPKDVSVIGCDNIFYSGIRRLSLTTIDHFVALKAEMPVTLLSGKLLPTISFIQASATSLYNIEYTPKLIARKTTAYARIKK